MTSIALPDGASAPPRSPRSRRSPRGSARRSQAPAAVREETWESRALVGLTLAAFAFGLMEMYSASSFLAASDGLPGHYFALKQLTGAVMGAVLAVVLARDGLPPLAPASPGPCC